MKRTEAAAEAEAEAEARAEATGAGVQPLRRDVVGADPLQAPLSSFAPEVVDGFFVTPPVATAEAQK